MQRGLTDLRRYAGCQTFAAVPMYEAMYEEMIVTGPGETTSMRSRHTSLATSSGRTSPDETADAALGTRARFHVEAPRRGSLTA
jgi:hypothetical protein